jgi:hypothetical protein
MSGTILGFGIVCLAAAIIGGELTAAGIKIPILHSLVRRALLGLFGLVLIAAANWTDVRSAIFPVRLASLTDGPTQLAPSAFHKTPLELGRSGSVETSMLALMPDATQPRVIICPAQATGDCPWRQLSAADAFSADMPNGSATVTVFNYPQNPPITYTLRIQYPEGSWMPATWVLVALAGLAALAAAVTLMHARRKQQDESLDELQRDVLRFMWNVQGGVMQFSQVQPILGVHANLVSIACEGLQKRELIAFNAYLPDSLVQLLPEGRRYAAAHGLTDANAILVRAATRLQQPAEPDYGISVAGTEVRITSLSERAQSRSPGELKKGASLAFRRQGQDLLDYIQASEAAGFTFSGKEQLESR